MYNLDSNEQFITVNRLIALLRHYDNNNHNNKAVRARGLGGCSPPPPMQTRAKPSFFGQKLIFFVFIKRKKRNSFRLARSARNPGFLLIITGWGESGKVILQVSMAVFSGTVEKIFGQRWLSALEKIVPYAYA